MPKCQILYGNIPWWDSGITGQGKVGKSLEEAKSTITAVQAVKAKLERNSLYKVGLTD